MAVAPPDVSPRAPATEARLFEPDSGSVAPAERAAFARGGVRPATLADRLSAGWAELATGATIGCLACGSAMEPSWSAGHGIVGGRCRSCGTSLD